MPDPKPWIDLISGDDLGSFQRGADAAARPMSAGTRPAIVVVDMTLAFVDSAYPTGHSETGWPAVAAVRRLLDVGRDLGIPIYFTKANVDPHHVNRPQEAGRWKVQAAAAQPAGLPPGDVIVDDLTPRENEIVIHKGQMPSGFFGTPLASYLLRDGVDTVIVTGMTTSGCVRATAVDAFQYNLNVVLPHECSADRSQISHRVNLFDLHMKYADVVSLDETIEYLHSTVRTVRAAAVVAG
jgi:maleamate amidohydrolase